MDEEDITSILITFLIFTEKSLPQHIDVKSFSAMNVDILISTAVILTLQFKRHFDGGLCFKITSHLLNEMRIFISAKLTNFTIWVTQFKI